MKILLTGIDGYIGTILSHKLQEAGHDVIGLDTGYYRSSWLYNIPGLQLHTVINKDIRDITADDVKGMDAVIHLAELSNDPLGQNNPEITYDINHRGTVKLAELAKKEGVSRFIYFSSCSVYGASENIADESSTVNPLTAYAKSKVMNEEALQKLADKSFAPIFFRNATVYGASPRLRFDLVVNNLAGLAFTTKEIKMDSDGTPWRPFVHISDVCQATILALEAPMASINNQIINIGNTKSNYQIKDIAEIIAHTFPGCTVNLNKDGADKRNYRVNFDKIKNVLPGFICQYDIAKGAEELRSIFTKVQLSTEDFQSRNFTRLKQIKYLLSTNQITDTFYWSPL